MRPLLTHLSCVSFTPRGMKLKDMTQPGRIGSKIKEITLAYRSTNADPYEVYSRHRLDAKTIQPANVVTRADIKPGQPNLYRQGVRIAVHLIECLRKIERLESIKYTHDSGRRSAQVPRVYDGNGPKHLELHPAMAFWPIRSSLLAIHKSAIRLKQRKFHEVHFGRIRLMRAADLHFQEV